MEKKKDCCAHHAQPAPSSERESFAPLVLIVSAIAAFTAVRYFMRGEPGWHAAMYDFMAGFFLVFGGFKLLDLKGFADAYRTYDVIAAKSRWYALCYPFLEIGLGALYLSRKFLSFANPAAFVLMSVGAVGVFRALAKKQKIRCACLGTKIRLPMTSVTLLEDVLMALMAAVMLLKG